jgi:hypothetical protein
MFVTCKPLFTLRDRDTWLTGFSYSRLEQDLEGSRYYPLVNSANAVLAHFSGLSIGGLTHVPGPDDLIYMIQDPAIIRSKPITNDSGSKNTLRKPDAIGTSVAHIVTLSGATNATSKPFSYWVTEFIANSEKNNEIKKNGQTKWEHCWNIWELKFAKQNLEVEFQTYTTAGVRSGGECEPAIPSYAP